jgi:hypothetical protein
MRRLDTPEYQFALRDEASLRELFEHVLREPRGAAQEPHMMALRDAVCGFVRRAKGDGRQVETVIIALKAIFAVPDRPNRAFTDEEDTPPNVVLARRVVRWCIQEFYGPGTDVPVSEG